ncbi:MAG: phage terminase large subunit [Bacillota bacterium]|nr:phage terminase large subunit [Bacillota bacterium]
MMIPKNEIAFQAQLELARRHYRDYLTLSNNGLYKHAPHTLFLCNKIEEIICGKDKRLMVFMPPRHGKSMTITESLPSYFLLKNPDKRVIISSYGDDLAQVFGRKNRAKIREYGKLLFNLDIAQDMGSVKAWNIENHVGGVVSSGIGGTITGQGADLLIIDDPVKNKQEAYSKTYRDRVYDEYKSTLRTRLHSGGSIIIILTRWHEDDLAGRLIKESGDNPDEKWEIINLPAICEYQNDVLGRQIGETLWPKGGYDANWAKQTEREVGSREWASLYQQRPSPAEGNIFKREWWKYYTKLPEKFDKIIQSWDFTFKETKESDFVVGQIWGKCGADAYLIDQVRKKADFVNSIVLIKFLTKKYPEARQKYIEDKANGTAIIQSLKREMSGIVPVTPTESKESRAYSTTPEIESGNVFLPDPTATRYKWIGDFIEECSTFPNGANDDQVDAMTQALKKLYGSGVNVLTPRN